MSWTRKVCIICEGKEETEYLKRLQDLGIFSKKYKFHFINARLINNILPLYQEKYALDSMHIILVFCDTEKKPYEEFKRLRKGLLDIHDNNKEYIDNIIIFANPCTMQIVLLHFGEIKLTTSSKSVNEQYISKLTGVEGYKANNKKLNELYSKIDNSSCKELKENLKKNRYRLERSF